MKNYVAVSKKLKIITFQYQITERLFSIMLKKKEKKASTWTFPVKQASISGYANCENGSEKRYLGNRIDNHTDRYLQGKGQNTEQMKTLWSVLSVGQWSKEREF